MDKIEKQRLAQLVRMGIVPSTKLQVLMQALAKAKLGAALSPVERNVMSIYLDKVQSFVLGNQSEFNRAKLHTQRTKYHTEETTVDIDENVRVVDGPEDMEVDQRMKDERKAKRLSVKKRDKYRLLSPELKKEKRKAGMDEEVVALNNTYKEMFEATLEYFEVSNIRDLPEEKKKEFFATVDEALEEAKMATKDHDGDGKIETSTAEYMGSRDKAIKKAMGKKVKEEVEQVDELKKSTLSSYIQKAADPVAKKSNVNLASKAAHKLATSDDMDAGEKEDRKAFVRSKGIQTAAKKLAKEEVEQVNEYITSKQVRMAKGIANDPRHKGGDYTGAAEKMEKIKKGLSNHPAAKKALRQANEEANMPNKGIEGDKESPKQGSSQKPAVGELCPSQDSNAKLKEAMSPEFKAKRLDMIRQAHDRVMTGRTRDAAKAKAAAKSAMKQKGAQKGMAPTKKDVEEQVQELRKMIKENNNKAEAYKLLAKILNNAENLGEQ